MAQKRRPCDGNGHRSMNAGAGRVASPRVCSPADSVARGRVGGRGSEFRSGEPRTARIRLLRRVNYPDFRSGEIRGLLMSSKLFLGLPTFQM